TWKGARRLEGRLITVPPLLIRGSQVRLLPGAPTTTRTSETPPPARQALALIQSLWRDLDSILPDEFESRPVRSSTGLFRALRGQGGRGTRGRLPRADRWLRFGDEPARKAIRKWLEDLVRPYRRSAA